MTHIIGHGRYARETYPQPQFTESEMCDTLVVVRSLGDLPTPTAGVIALAANTNYQFCGVVDISPNSLSLDDRTTLSGLSPVDDVLRSSGFAAPAMISIGAGKNALVRGVSLSSPGGTLFDADLGGTASLVILDSLLVGSASLGTIKNFVRFNGIGVGIAFNADGWTILGTNGDVLWTTIRVSDNVGSFTLFTVPEESGVSCENMLFDAGTLELGGGQTGFDFPTPAAGLSVLRGAMSALFFSGAGTPLAVGPNKITKATLEWTISMSPPLLDSVSVAGASYALTGSPGNSTGALTTGTFVPIPSAPSPFIASASNERFSAAPSGVLTYTGLDPIQVQVQVSVSVDMTGSGTANYGCAIFRNGGLVADSEQTNQMSAAGSATSAVTTSAVITLNNGDTIEGRIRNNTNVNPMNVYSARISVVPAS